MGASCACDNSGSTPQGEDRTTSQDEAKADFAMALPTILEGSREGRESTMTAVTTEETQEDPGNMLLEASVIGDQPSVEKLLSQGVNAETTDSLGQTPLMLAVQNEHLEIVKILIDNGATSHLSSEPVNGSTPLLDAIASWKAEMVTFLLEKGASKDVLHSQLFSACEEENLNKTKLLIRCGADTEVRNDEGMTPLLFSICKCKLGSVQCLLEHGADLDVRDKDGQNPLGLAVDTESLELVNALIDEGLSEADKDMLGRRLVDACKKGLVTKVDFLISCGADANMKDDDACTPLLLAVNASNLELVRLLLKKGAKTVVKNKAGVSPLILAASKGKADIAKLIATKASKADKDALAKKLLETCTKSDWKKAKTLLSCGASTEAKDSKGETPLFKTVAISNKEAAQMTKLLIEKGANKAVASKSGECLLRFAAMKANLEMVQLLVDKKVALPASEAEALGNDLIENGNKWCVSEGETKIKAALVAGARTDVTNSNGETMLMNAALQGAKDFARVLLGHGVDVQARGGLGNTTALYMAARSKHVHLASMIVEAGGGTSEKDPDGDGEWQSLLKSKNMAHVKEGSKWVLRTG